MELAINVKGVATYFLLRTPSPNARNVVPRMFTNLTVRVVKTSEFQSTRPVLDFLLMDRRNRFIAEREVVING
jgi:hypothetical protein